MKAIRPIYDGIDDLDDLDRIDYIDMMACLFSIINESIEAMDNINEEARQMLKDMADKEILPIGVIKSDKGINDDLFVAEAEGEYDLYNGTGLDELIVLFEIIRWLKENLYEWESVITPKFKCTAYALGICPENNKFTVSPFSRDDYVLSVGSKAFHELKLLLPLHWATVLLDWYPVSINGIDNKEMLEFGNLMIVVSEDKQEMNKDKLWKNAQSLLKDRITALSYETWIEPLAYISINEEQETVYLSWPGNPKLINHINDHYITSIESAIAESSNKKYRVLIRAK